MLAPVRTQRILHDMSNNGDNKMSNNNNNYKAGDMVYVGSINTWAAQLVERIDNDGGWAVISKSVPFINQKAVAYEDSFVESF